MVAAAGAVPWPQTTSGSPRSALHSTIGRSLPGPFRCGSTTWSVKPVATAASKALPPRSSIARPVAEASQWVEATIPKVPRSSGRVVKLSPALLPAPAWLDEARRLGPATDEVTRHEMPLAGDVDERRLLVGRARGRLVLQWAPCAEPAPGGRLDRARDVSLEHDAAAGALKLGVGLEGSGEKRLRVRMLRPREQLLSRSDLDDLAEVHHRHAVAQELDGGEIVADEEAREPELAPEVAHEVED